MLMLVLAYLIAIVFALMCHELSHGFVAYKCGDKTAKLEGRLSLNPAKLLDLWGSLSFLFVGFGWAKPVPVNPLNFRNYKRDMALVSISGVITNILLAFLAVPLFMLCSRLDPSNLFFVFLTYLTMFLVVINISLAVFNLIPIPPLDGSKVLGSVLPAKFNFYMYKYQRYIYIGFLVLLFTGLLQVPISWLVNLFYKLINLLFFWVDPLIRAILG